MTKKITMANIQPGQDVLVSYRNHEPIRCKFIQKVGEGDEARAQFQFCDDGTAWEAYKFRGRWVLGSSADTFRMTAMPGQEAPEAPAEKTLAQKFTALAEVLAPGMFGLVNLDPKIDDANMIDEIMFARGEYLGGHASVILTILKDPEAAARAISAAK